MSTLTEKQLASAQLIQRLLDNPTSFKGTTLSHDKYDLFYRHNQNGHTLFSALISTGHYTCAKNILKRLPQKNNLYNEQADERVLTFCNFEKCGRMAQLLKAPGRRALTLAGLSRKERSEIESIAALIKNRLSTLVLEEWSDSRPISEDFMTNKKPPVYSSADAVARALEEEEDARYERFKKPEKSLSETLQNYADKAPTKPVESKSARTIITGTDKNGQTNFDALLLNKQSERE